MLTVSKMDVWSTSVDDQPGGLHEKLEGLAISGADLDFIVSRRAHEQPGKSLVFVTPIVGDKQTAAALRLGFKVADSLHSLCVRGPDEPGIGNRVTGALAREGINLRGASAARAGKEFVMFLAFDDCRDLERAMARLSLNV
jgi:hypothetical protein